MPIAKDQTMFEMEYCDCHSKPATLLVTFTGAYCWRCTQGGHVWPDNPAWVTTGSQMDIYNNLVDPTNEARMQVQIIKIPEEA